MTIHVTSWSFSLEDLPVEYTGDGRNVSPPLEWTPGPEGTRSYVLIMDDPDGPRGQWVHWVAWNIRDTKLPENLPKQATIATEAGYISQGRNSYNRLGYCGPCPPGGTHRYFVKIYALDTVLDLGPDSTKRDLLAAMDGHILDDGELMVTHSQARALKNARAVLAPRATRKA